MKSTLNVFLTVCYDWIMYSHQILIGARHGVGDGGLLTVRDRGSRSLWPMLFFFKSFLKFILISDGTESSLLSRLSLVRVRRGCSLVAGHRLSVAVVSLAAEHGLLSARASVVAAPGLPSCGPGSRPPAQQLRCPGLVALWHVEFS